MNQKSLNKTEKDILKIIKKYNRLYLKFEPTKVTKNKKKYKRVKYKYNKDDI